VRGNDFSECARKGPSDRKGKRGGKGNRKLPWIGSGKLLCTEINQRKPHQDKEMFDGSGGLNGTDLEEKDSAGGLSLCIGLSFAKGKKKKSIGEQRPNGRKSRRELDESVPGGVPKVNAQANPLS